MLKIKNKGKLLLLILFSQAVLAKDLGTFGAIFPIVEENLLEVIKNKIKKLAKDGDLEKHQQNIFSQMMESIEKPPSVEGLIKTKTARTFLYDPSITVPYDLRDHQGNVFHKAGTTVNPLESYQLKRPLLFINGEDEEQVNWALEYKRSNPKIILVQGAPFEIMKKHNIPIYFDQGGILVKKFGLKQVPARITQSGKSLKVEEVLPNQESNP